MATTILVLSVSGGRPPSLGDLFTLSSALESQGIDPYTLDVVAVEVSGDPSIAVQVPHEAAEAVAAAYRDAGVEVYRYSV